MKKLRLIIVLLFGIMFFGASEAEAKPADVSFHYFYSSLRPHGTWIELNDGMVVWRPRGVSVSWSPYSRGEWVWTNQGWYWSSYEPYGEIVYHYGRWYHDDWYGWIWVPDYTWAPAWVEWRYDNAYVGWAPLPPYATFSVSVGIRYTRHYTIHYGHWNFVKIRYFCNPYVNRHFVHSKYKMRRYNQTRLRTSYIYRNNGVYNRGIGRDVVVRNSGRDLRERQIVFNNGRNSTVNRNDNRIVVNRHDGKDRNFTKGDIRLERGNRSSTLQTRDVKIGETTRRLKDVKVDKMESRTLKDIERNRTDVKRNDTKINRNKTDKTKNKDVKRDYKDYRNKTEVKKNKTYNRTEKTHNKTNKTYNRTKNTEVRNKTTKTKAPFTRKTETKRNDNGNLYKNKTNTTRNKTSFEKKERNTFNRDNKTTVKKNKTYRTDKKTTVRKNTKERNTKTFNRNRNNDRKTTKTYNRTSTDKKKTNRNSRTNNRRR